MIRFFKKILGITRLEEEAATRHAICDEWKLMSSQSHFTIHFIDTNGVRDSRIIRYDMTPLSWQDATPVYSFSERMHMLSERFVSGEQMLTYKDEYGAVKVIPHTQITGVVMHIAEKESDGKIERYN